MDDSKSSDRSLFDEALERLGSEPRLPEPAWRSLQEKGYWLAADLIAPSSVQELQILFEHACSAKHELVPKQGTRHVPRLMDFRLSAAESYAHPILLTAVRSLMGREFLLTGVGGRDPLPGFGQQGLHADWGPRYDERVQAVTALWMLDDFDSSNGPTRVVPGTHRLLSLPPRDLAKPVSRHPDETFVFGGAGSLLVFNGHLWHSGTKNESQRSRRAIQCTFVGREHRSMAIEPPSEIDACHQFLFG